MTLLDPAERTARGAAEQAARLARPAPEPATLYEASWRDYVFAEIWTRPGLDPRARTLIALGTAACAGDVAATQDYARGALAGDAVTLGELREAALHLAVYGGWSAGGVLDRAASAAAGALGLPPADTAPIRAAPWAADARLREGQANFAAVMHFPGGPPDTPYAEGGICNFVFGEMWSRPGLDRRARRWLTLVGVGNSSSDIPIRSHVWTAMASGDATRAEMGEFVLQYAIHAGWPRASVMNQAVAEQAARVEQGLPFQR